VNELANKIYKRAENTRHDFIKVKIIEANKPLVVKRCVE
jgi:hypothetical protein